MKYPWMPLFNGDLLADTMHLSAQEFGAYMLLIIHAWKHDGRVPYDRAMRIARIRAYHWPRVFRQLEPFFEWERDSKGAPLWGTQSRVLTEIHNAAEITNKRKGAAEHMLSKRRANAQHMLPQSQSHIESSVREEGSKPTVVDYRDKGVSYRSPPGTKLATKR